MRRTLGTVLGVAILLTCLCVPAATIAWLRMDPGQDSPTPTPVASVSPTMAPLPGPTTDEILAGITVPPRDSRTLAARLRLSQGAIPEVVNADPPEDAVGQQAKFWVSNSDTMEVFQVSATLRVLSQHAEFWVQDGIPYDEDGLKEAAAAFDQQIYPTVHQYFGSEWTPGVDNNPRLIVLNARFTGAAGYFSSHDEFSRQINPYSNEREMIYLNLDATPPGTEFYLGTLAHEMQHMVHWHVDSNEDGWVNEGASELSTELAGYDAAGGIGSFARKPDTQLNAWALSPDEDTLPHYGASYLWLEYFMQRMGPEAVKSVIAEQANGIDAFEQVLQATPGDPTFDELFADWVVANYLDDQSLLDGRYGHKVANPHMMVEATQRTVPVQASDTVGQYATDYVMLAPRSGPLSVEVWGNATVPVVPNTPYQGRYEWWSNRGDMSDTTLTRSFDLTSVKKATLQYALWYELEDGWDYAYVEVSTDNGATWKPLATGHTTDYNPNGNAFGPGYTGYSGHPAGSEEPLNPTWVRESVDLSPYAGKNIQVRFELITDDAVNLPGLCIDDISIPELNYQDDAESEAGGWQASGWARMDNILPQKLQVQLIEQGKETRIQRLELSGGEHGTLTISDYGSDIDRAVLAISGLTRYTTEEASYTYSLTQAAR